MLILKYFEFNVIKNFKKRKVHVGWAMDTRVSTVVAWIKTACELYDADVRQICITKRREDCRCHKPISFCRSTNL